MYDLSSFFFFYILWDVLGTSFTALPHGYAATGTNDERRKERNTTGKKRDGEWEKTVKKNPNKTPKSFFSECGSYVEDIIRFLPSEYFGLDLLIQLP